MSLLIVDDSELIRAALQQLLERIAGIDAIFSASTLAQARHTVLHQHPNFTILELHLPDGHALAHIPALQLLEPQMHIAVLTNDASEFNRRKCLQTGVHWFFDKSTEFESLLSIVRHQAALT